MINFEDKNERRSTYRKKTLVKKPLKDIEKAIKRGQLAGNFVVREKVEQFSINENLEESSVVIEEHNDSSGSAEPNAHEKVISGSRSKSRQH